MCIYLMKNQPASVAKRFALYSVGDVVMSAITYAELEYGVSVSPHSKREARTLAELIEDIHVAPFDAAAAVSYGPIRLATRDSKKDHLDKLIAAHSVSLGSVLVTNNLKDFARYPDVVLENWI